LIKLEDKMEDISRFEMHKDLKTWHFDLNSTKQDYEIAYHIDNPDEWWEKALEEVTRKADQSVLNNGFFSGKKETDPAVNSLLVDVKNSQAPEKDIWFMRGKISKDFMFYELMPDNLEHADMRLATQLPMDMTYRHIDHEHQQISSNREEFEMEELKEIFGSRGKWRKYIILVEDLKAGQVFYWGNSIVKAKRGDVIVWDYGVPHWTVNFSSFTRHSLMITGKLT
jgi:hypothetical protein